MANSRSNWWYLLPLFLGLIGGIIGYFIIKKDDPEKGRNVLIVGIVIFMIGVITNVIYFTTMLVYISPAMSLMQ